MFLEIRNRVNKELKSFIRGLNKSYGLNSLSPLIINNIKDFALRNGKRVRPVLFCIGYLGYAKKACRGLYKSAISLELLHDFMLVHDDIIDKSSTRRGKPSMHSLLNRQIKRYGKVKFSGQDLAIVIGDVLYAIALDAFLAAKESPERKERALRKLISAALYTGSGEFVELLLGAKSIDKTTKNDIYKIYDFKTANYTFSSPLSMGAILANAEESEIRRICEYGMLLGRAFQIEDDIIGTFGKPSKTGKSSLTDILEAKKTILLWYAYNRGSKKQKNLIRKTLTKDNPKAHDVKEIRKILIATKSLDFARNEVRKLVEGSNKILHSLKISKKAKTALKELSRQIFSI